MTDETITLRRGFYETLIAAHKALIVRGGGYVEIPYEELDEASQKRAELRYEGDKNDPENGTWTFRVTDDEPPTEPWRVEDDDRQDL